MNIVVSVPFGEETILSLLNGFGALAENQLVDHSVFLDFVFHATF